MIGTFNAATSAPVEGTRDAKALIAEANEVKPGVALRRLGVPQDKGGSFDCPADGSHYRAAAFDKDELGNPLGRWRCSECDAGGSVVDLAVRVNQARGKVLSDADAARLVLGIPTTAHLVNDDAGEITTSQCYVDTVENELAVPVSSETRPENSIMSNGSTRAAVRPRGLDDRQRLRLMNDQNAVDASPLIAAETPLAAAKAAIEVGLQPIPIHAIGETIKTKHGPKIATGKEPIGAAWGRTTWTEERLNEAYGQNEERNVGLLMGPQGGIIDIEIDQPEGADAETFAHLADEEFAELCGGEIPDTVGWRSHRGCHRIYLWDDRLRVCAENKKNAFHYGRLEIRLGANGQTQSVIPPSAHKEGERAWLGGSTVIARLPDVAIDRIIEAARPKPKEVKPQASAPVRCDNPDHEPKRLDDEAKRLLGQARRLADNILNANKGDTNTGRHPTALASARTMGGLVAGHVRHDLAGEIHTILIEAYRASKPELPPNDPEFMQCIGDGWNDGTANPITLEDRNPPEKLARGHATTVKLPEEFGGPRKKRTLADMGFTSASAIETEPIDYLIPGIMARGELTLIVGAAGSGKTKVAITRAAKLTTGEGIDGKPVKGGAQRIAIISFEECPRRTIKPVCQHSGMNLDNAEIYDQPEGEAGIDSLGALCEMLEALADAGVSYVLIDSLTALYSRLGYDVNDVKIPYAIHGEINRVARQKNICVELIHHYGKASGAAYDNHQKAAGSYAIFASVRSMLQVEHDMVTGTRFIGVSPNKNNLGLLHDCLAFRTARVAEHLNDGQGYIIAELAGWNKDESIDDITTRITKAKNDDLRKRIKPVAVEVADAITTFVDSAGGVAAVTDIDKHLAKAKYASNAVRDGKKGFERFQVRRLKKWFLTTIDEKAARAIIEARFPEKTPDVEDVSLGDSESEGEMSLGDRE